jgi:putative colanic acid biosynthesis acetyltransferase WcaB
MSYNLFQDWDNNPELKSKLIMFMFRLGNFLYYKYMIFRPLYYVYSFFYRIITEWFLCVEIPLKCIIGPRFTIYHGFCIVIHPCVSFGSDVTLRQCVTIGNKGGGDRAFEVPKFGNNIEVGTSSVILGNILISDDVVIGACSLVTKSISSKSTVVGRNVILNR